jgi:general secretion pathway protein E
LLRQDPDIIMIGEIRDRETADMAIQAALTGHLVLSTLHTNDSPSAARKHESSFRIIITSQTIRHSATRRNTGGHDLNAC